MLLEDRVRHHRDDESSGEPYEEGRVRDVVTTGAEREGKREKGKEGRGVCECVCEELDRGRR